MILTLLISLLLLQVAEGNTFSSAKYYADATENVSPSAGSDASVMPGPITVASSEGQAALQAGLSLRRSDSDGAGHDGSVGAGRR